MMDSVKQRVYKYKLNVMIFDLTPSISSPINQKVRIYFLNKDFTPSDI